MHANDQKTAQVDAELDSLRSAMECELPQLTLTTLTLCSSACDCDGPSASMLPVCTAPRSYVTDKVQPHTPALTLQGSKLYAHILHQVCCLAAGSRHDYSTFKSKLRPQRRCSLLAAGLCRAHPSVDWGNPSIGSTFVYSS